MPRLLLLEDDVPLGAALERVLCQADFAVSWARLCADALQALAHGGHAVAILDIQLPDGSGFDVLGKLRRENNPIPVLMLTVRDAVDDRVHALDDGADDYLVKPCHPAELISRVRALLRRSAGQSSPMWKVGPLWIEPLQRRVSLGDELLDLSPKEFQLLLELARHAGKVVSRSHLEAVILHSPEAIGSNLLDVHMFNLRRKLDLPLIRTVRGVGYLLDTPA